jgi:prepilin-type N-terminal cleavage/methylation domain-containing protein
MKRTHGFTLIEVMLSLAVMSIGAAAMFALQGLVARSNLYSKQITVATQIAEVVVERLKIDAMNWTAAGSETSPATALSNTVYLADIGSNANTWIPLDTNNGFSHSSAFTALSENIAPADLSTRADEIAYCAAIKLAWAVTGDSIRADVRVWWQRGSMPGGMEQFGLCDANLDSLDPGGANEENYHAIYMSTVLRWTALPGT